MLTSTSKLITKKNHLWAALTLLLVAPLVSADCNLDYTNQQGMAQIRTMDSDYPGFQGIGVSQLATGISLNELLEQARQNAVVALAQSVSVSVNSVIQLNESRTNETISSNFLSHSSLQTRRTLDQVQLVGYWFDSKNCALWAKVQLSNSKANLSVIESLLSRLTSSFTSAQQGQQLLTQVKQLSQELTLEPEDRSQLEQNVLVFEQTFQRQLTAQEELEKARVQLEKLNSASRGKKIRAYRALSLTLREQLPWFIGRQQGLNLLPELVEQISFLYHRQNDNCTLQRFLAQFPQFEQEPWYQNFTEEKSHRCQQDDSLASQLVGSFIKLECELTLEQQTVFWSKICADLANYFFKKNAIPVYEPEAEQTTDFIVLVKANGFIERKNSDSTKRFNGKVTVSFTDEFSPVMEDSYSGISGWSQYPDEIVLDLLALNVYKRFEQKLTQLE